jgi:SAM-dependent methyltransferase
MNQERTGILAASLSAYDVRLLEHLPYLLQDLYELGSDAKEIANLLSCYTPLKTSARVLDLGCGKGAVAIEVAKTFGCPVVGVDLMPAFIAEARQMARKEDVEHLCSFTVGDISEWVKHTQKYDVVIYGAVGEVLGTQRELLTALHPIANYMIIDDAYSIDEKSGNGLNQWYQAFIDCSFDIIAEVIADRDKTNAINQRNQEQIEMRAEQLSRTYPEQAYLFSQYVVDQRAECKELATQLQGVTWLMQAV